MTYYNEFKFIELLKSVETRGTSPELNNFYEHVKEIKNSELITRLIHRVSLSVSTIPKQFNNCAGNFANFKNSKLIVIVGEKPSAKSPLNKSYPFLDITGSSGWLNTQLNRTQIRENQLFWVNALNIDDSENDPEIINQLKPYQIICLGKVAESWANKNGWKNIYFPHPQYWKRFKSKIPYPLIEYLRATPKS